MKKRSADRRKGMAETMKCSEWDAVALALSGIFICVLAHGQPSMSATRKLTAPDRSTTEELIRQIDDPNTGDHWLLTRDRTHPSGPGRLARVAATSDAPSSGATAARPPAPPEPQPVIRRGDRLVLEESTARVQARFEAIALGPALAGSPLRVRMVLGGKVVRAVALGPGRVAFAPQTEVLP
jgi:hypothetical protein